jgi:hypothetical protein
VNGRATHLDSDDGVQHPYGRLERFKVAILVREDTKVACVNPKANACVHVFLRGLEPGITLGLHANVYVNGASRIQSMCKDVTCLKMWWRSASYAS